ncbi:condensation domain-containing protein, partial [Pseudoalteromonas piscicida]
LVLSKHSNSTDIVIGTPIANRLQQEIAPMIGFFTNTLALRADTNHATLTEYFRHIKQVNLDAQSHQDVPFEQLVDRLKVERSAAHTPLFQIVMTMQ